jgi:hypothetical protein
MSKSNKDKWVYWRKGDTIRIVCNRQVVYTLPKKPQDLYKLISATRVLKESATNSTQENTQ